MMALFVWTVGDLADGIAFVLVVVVLVLMGKIK